MRGCNVDDGCEVKQWAVGQFGIDCRVGGSSGHRVLVLPVHGHSIGITRIGVSYVDDTFGEDGLAGAEKGFIKTNLKPVVVEKFNRLKPDFALITPKVVESKAQAILMVAASQALLMDSTPFEKALKRNWSPCPTTLQAVLLKVWELWGMVKS